MELAPAREKAHVTERRERRETRTDFVQRPAALTTLRNKIKINKIKDFLKIW